MTTEQFIELAKTCRNRAELLIKLGNYENTNENKKKYIQPLREAAGLTIQQLTDLFVKDRKSTRLNSSHVSESRMPSSA